VTHPCLSYLLCVDASKKLLIHSPCVVGAVAAVLQLYVIDSQY